MDKDVYTKRLQNQVNNAKVAQSAISKAGNSKNAKVRAVGKALKAGDKLTGGKVSNTLGRQMSKRPLLNKISSAAQAGLAASNFFNSRNKSQEQYGNDEPTEIDYKASIKKPFIAIGAVAVAGFFVIIISFCILVLVVNTVTVFDLLDDANNTFDFENLNDDEVDKKFDEKKAEKKIDKYLGDSSIELSNDYVVKLNSSDEPNLKLVSKEDDEYIEKMMDRYSSSISSLKDYDEKKAYRFFSKLYYIEKYYAKNYGVSLDMPLLMSTLKVQSDDLGEVFTSNVVWYERIKKDNNPNYSYAKDWSHYIPTKYDSSHDIELLAQHMVSNQVKEYCVTSAGSETKSQVTSDYREPTITCGDGETYKTTSLGYQIDREKYREFLYLFIETKYYSDTKDKKFDWDQDKGPGTGDSLPSNVGNDNESSSDSGNTSTGKTNDLARAMINLANKEISSGGGTNGGLKYRNAYGIGNSAWCAIFVWYLSANTTVNGVSIYPNIVNHKSNSTGSYMRWFVDNEGSNVKFYYNDSCSYYKDKNGIGYKYTPKEGDYVFFDWSPNKPWTYSNDVQDHIGIVESYTDGKLRTIEGNINNNIRKINRGSLNNCEIIGFGSWY